MPTAVPDTLLAHTTVRFPTLQFNAVMKQFVATRKVPIEVSEQGQNRPFVAAAGEAKAVTQITDRFITQREA